MKINGISNTYNRRHLQKQQNFAGAFKITDARVPMTLFDGEIYTSQTGARIFKWLNNLFENVTEERTYMVLAEKQSENQKNAHPYILIDSVFDYPLLIGLNKLGIKYKYFKLPEIDSMLCYSQKKLPEIIENLPEGDIREFIN